MHVENYILKYYLNYLRQTFFCLKVQVVGPTQPTNLIQPSTVCKMEVPLISGNYHVNEIKHFLTLQ